jgi:hypothetical protein
LNSKAARETRKASVAARAHIEEQWMKA